jgi:membrane-associated protease RseP (regulator of RpoE activity)
VSRCGGILIPFGHDLLFAVPWTTFLPATTSGSSYTQNNVRAGAGIACLFSSPRTNVINPQATTVLPGIVPIASIGVKVIGNLEVFDVAPGSPADKAGIVRGDVINSVDGKDLSSIAQLEAALKSKSEGTVRIGYLVRGSWQTESVLTLGGAR